MTIPTADQRSAAPPDPRGFAGPWSQLGFGSKRSGAAAALLASSVIPPDEKVELVLVGRYRGENAVMVLTDRALTLVNARQWSPEIEVIEDIGGCTIEGWIDKRLATIRVSGPKGSHVVDSIADTALAERMTAALRSR